MKKAAVILLLLIYSLASFGITSREFYCCGKLKSKSVLIADTGQNNCAGGKGDDSCCKTKYQYLKVSDDHFVADQVLVSLNMDTHLGNSDFPAFENKLNARETTAINGSHSPPFYSTISVYLFNCVFRI